MRLLIADDDRALSLLLSTRLRTMGWTVDVAHDAMQALMFDIAMPGGTGIEALKKLKRSAKTMQIPIVVLSGSIEPEEEPKVLGLGAAAFLRKPTDIDALNELLVKLVKVPSVA
jgi:two-component system response regulator CpxR